MNVVVSYSNAFDAFSLDQFSSARRNASHVDTPPAPPVWPAEDVFSIMRCVSDFSSSAFADNGGSITCGDEDDESEVLSNEVLLVAGRGGEKAWPPPWRQTTKKARQTFMLNSVRAMISSTGRTQHLQQQQQE